MNDLNTLFFELIRVSIGTQDCLSHIPFDKEWQQLYEMAKKQSLVGVCFAGLQRVNAALPLVNERGEGSDGLKGLSGLSGSEGSKGNWARFGQEKVYDRIGMSKMLYLTWMGKAARIQLRNGVMNQQCAILCERFKEKGFRCCVLKGQGVAQLYYASPQPSPESEGVIKSHHSEGELEEASLAMLRQSGDIDLWIDAPKKDVVDWAMKVGITEEAGYLHVGVRCFKNTEVELHYRPTYLRSIRHNRRLQNFCESHKADWTERNGIVVPSWEFDVVYQLSHIYRHLFGLGIGMRQLMDYYWTLSSSPLKGENFDLQKTLKHFGLHDFAGAVMYVMREVFGLDERYMICTADEKRGQMLLKLVMQTGNFGHLDEKQKAARSTTAGNVMYKLRQWCELLRLYPEETLSAPLWNVVKRCMK